MSLLQRLPGRRCWKVSLTGIRSGIVPVCSPIPKRLPSCDQWDSWQRHDDVAFSPQRVARNHQVYDIAKPFLFRNNLHHNALSRTIWNSTCGPWFALRSGGASAPRTTGPGFRRGNSLRKSRSWLIPRHMPESSGIGQPPQRNRRRYCEQPADGRNCRTGLRL